MKDKEFERLKKLLTKPASDKHFKSLTHKLEQEKVFTRRSRHALERFRRNLILEIVMGTTAILILIALLFLLPAQSSFFLILLPLMVFAVLFFVFGHQVLKIKTAGFSHVNLRQILNESVLRLRKFIRIYFLLNWILFPVLVGWGLLVSDLVSSKGFFLKINGYPFWMIFAGTATFLITSLALFYYPLKWYTKKMFGNHLKKVETTLDDLNQQAEE